MNRIHHLLIPVVFLSMFADGCNPSPGAVGQDEYAIYSAVVNHLVDSTTQATVVFIFDSSLASYPGPTYNQTDSGRMAVYHDHGIGRFAPDIGDSFKRIWPDLNSAKFPRRFAEQNARAYHLDLNSMQARVPVLRWNQDSLNSKTVQSGQAYLFWFSRPIQSDSGNEAIIYFDYICGFSCGEGNLCWLKRIGGSWKVFERHITWVS